MKRRTRIQYTEADKALMWERWRQGESLHAIARLFNRYHPSIGCVDQLSPQPEAVTASGARIFLKRTFNANVHEPRSRAAARWACTVKDATAPMS